MKKLSIMVVSLLFISLMSCEEYQQKAKSDSGVTKATVKVKTDQNGHTVEQTNYMKRVILDNDLGSIKHLYVISSYTGNVMEYYTVKGKVTSGGKRLSPKTVNHNFVDIGDKRFLTNELMDEYGMFGESMSYTYWFDAQDNYHQYFPSGGTYLHISDKPLRINKSSMTFTQE